MSSWPIVAAAGRSGFVVVVVLVAGVAGFSVSAIGCKMLCRAPFRGNGVTLFGCGQCMPCRINRRRKWTARLLLECASHEVNTFLTLTYAPEFLPPDGSLRPADYKTFLEALRYANGREAVRYYVVGEYGDKTFRPHFHFILFGVHPQQFDWSKLWKRGRTHAGLADIGSHAYVTGYVSKKMTRSHDYRLTQGLPSGRSRVPEFARMSRRPGVGAAALKLIAQNLTTRSGSIALVTNGDIPNEIRIGGKTYPLDRWGKEYLRKAILYPSHGTDSPGCHKAAQKVQAVLDRATVTAPPPLSWLDPIVWRYVQLTENEYNAMVNRRKLFTKERPI